VFFFLVAEFWLLIELPTLWTFAVIPLVCPTADGQDTVKYFVLDHGRLIVDSRLKVTFDILSISLGFIVPVGVLVFCNCCLISSLRQSYPSSTFRLHEATFTRDKPLSFKQSHMPRKYHVLSM